MAGFDKRRFRWTLAAVAMALAAAGCGGGPEAMLRDYVERVQRVAGVEVLDGGYQASLLAYPDRRDRRLPTADLRINLLEFLDLADCGLQALVGERNSSLGRVMPESRRLVYEHRLLVGARHCRAGLDEADEDRDDLRRMLDRVIAAKRADLPRAYWNATFGGGEFERMFSLAAPPLAVDAGPAGGAEVEQALAYLDEIGARLGTAALALDASALEARYRVLQSRRLAGELLAALDLLRFYLDAAATAIETRLDDRPVCYQRRATPTARVFETVFYKFYAGRVQPYLARAHRQARDWLTRVDRLAGRQRALATPAFAAYNDAQLSLHAADGLWARYQRARHRHTRAWQELLGQCGLMPGSPAAEG